MRGEWETFTAIFRTKPQAWVRPQFRILQNRAKRSARWPLGEPFLSSYSSKPMQRAVEFIAAHGRKVWGDREPVDGIIELDATFFMPMPKSRPANHVGPFEPGAPHVIKPDASNLLKLIEDALEGIWFVNDSRIYAPRPTKLYANGSPSILVVMRWKT